MRVLHVKGKQREAQQQFLLDFIVWEEKVAINKAEGTKLNKLVKDVTMIVHYDSTFAGIIKIILNLALASKEYNETIVLFQILNIVEEVMGSGFLTRMSA